jgi:hypothetical protein
MSEENKKLSLKEEIKFTPDNVKPFQLIFTPSSVSLMLNRDVAYKGLPDCMKCKGAGILEHNKPCKYCVRRTGNCPVCRNTGMSALVIGKKCTCIWGKDRK